MCMDGTGSVNSWRLGSCGCGAGSSGAWHATSAAVGVCGGGRVTGVGPRVVLLSAALVLESVGLLLGGVSPAPPFLRSQPSGSYGILEWYMLAGHISLIEIRNRCCATWVPLSGVLHLQLHCNRARPASLRWLTTRYRGSRPPLQQP